jgi:ergothioneine biosynthesis protein EgtB
MRLSAQDKPSSEPGPLRKPPVMPRTESEKAATTRRDADQSPDQLRAHYAFVRHTTEQLTRPLSSEDCQVQSMPDASPTKWHLAHTSWFFETFVLADHAPGYHVFDPTFKFLFNSYYNAIGDRLARPNRGLITRPSLDEVYAYRASVDHAMQSYFETAGESLDADVADVIELGINHEQQHQELILTDIKYALAQNPLRPAYREGVAISSSSSVQAMEWLNHPGGLEWVGHDGDGFAFDNEGPRHRVFVSPYQLASRLVTSGEYTAFIDDGGYARPELWLSDGWSAMSAQKWKAPLYWEKSGGEYGITTLGGFRPVSHAEPVCHVSFYEADAFARWAGARLPTEFEWELAASNLKPAGNFLESGHFHPRPAELGAGIAQCFGDVWEWVQSSYSPYPGSRPAPGALGEYNAKFMCNQIVLRGGSCVTPVSHIRATYRNFFPPEARWQFSGIRLARDV